MGRLWRLGGVGGGAGLPYGKTPHYKMSVVRCRFLKELHSRTKFLNQTETESSLTLAGIPFSESNISQT